MEYNAERKIVKSSYKEKFVRWEHIIKREQFKSVFNELNYCKILMNCAYDAEMISARIEYYREIPENATMIGELSLQRLLTTFIAIRRYVDLHPMNDTEDLIKENENLSGMEKEWLLEWLEVLRDEEYLDLPEGEWIQFTETFRRECEEKIGTELLETVSVDFIVKNRSKINDYIRITKLNRAKSRYFASLDTEPDPGLGVLDDVEEEVFERYL